MRDIDHPLFTAWRTAESWIAGRLLLSPHAAFYSPDRASATCRRKSAEAALRDGRLVNCVNRAWLEPHSGWLPEG